MTLSDQPAQRFGHFTVTALLARGGMSHIFVAKADGAYGFRRLAVVKRMLPALSEDARLRETFLREAQIGLGLQHPSIAQVFESGEQDGHLYLALEFVDGVDLRVALARLGHDRTRMPVALSLYVVREVCRGLHFAHQLKAPDGSPLDIVHRDVSPSNVLLSRDGLVKLCDFGIATCTNAGPTAAELRGKYRYLSPEQARSEPVDARTDVFSAGLVLWELVMGRRMYEADSEAGILELAKRAEIPNMLLKDVPEPERLAKVLRRALEPDLVRRTSSALELRLALDEYAASTSQTAGADELSAFLETACDKELRRRARRRAGEKPDGEPTPVTPLPEPRPAAVAEAGTATRRTSRASVPKMAVEAVSFPPIFPEIVSTPLIETPMIVAKPEERSGRVPSAGARSTAGRHGFSVERLVEHLTSTEGLTAAQIDNALTQAARSGQSLSTTILQLGLLDDSQLCHALSEVHRIPTVDLSSWQVGKELAKLLPESLSGAHQLVPFRLEKARGKPVLCVATADPDAGIALREVELHAGMRTKLFLARRDAVAVARDRLYQGSQKSVPQLEPKKRPNR